MNARTINLTLRTSAVALALAGVGALAGAVWLPMSSAAQSGGAAPSAGPPRTQPADRSLPSAKLMAAALDRRLRVPLGDAEPDSEPGAVASAAPAAAASTMALPTITMVGAIGDAVALLRGPDGIVVARSVGDEISGAKVLAVRPGAVDVQFNGRTVTLDKPRPDAAGAPIIVDGASSLPGNPGISLPTPPP